MMLHPRVTRAVLDLVKRFEGLRRRAARLPDGGWTLGYGHTRSAREGAVVTAEDAEALLYYDLSEVAQKVEAWTFTPLNQNQFEALTAFAFNIGLDNFRHSTVLKRVNEGQHLMAAAALELWRKSDFDGEGLVVDALVRRRAAEKAHYLTPPEGFSPSPTPVLKPRFDHSVIEAAAHSHAGRCAVLVDAPLEGEDATAVAHPPLQDPEETAAPTRDDKPKTLFPEPEAHAPETHAPGAYAPAATDFALAAPLAAASLAASPLVERAADRPFGHSAFTAPDSYRDALAAPPAPHIPAAASNDPAPAMADAWVDRGFEPPPTRPLATLHGRQDFGHTPAATEAAPLFDAPSPREPLDAAGIDRHGLRWEGRFQPAAPTSAATDLLDAYRADAYKTEDYKTTDYRAGPARDRSMLYLGVGLLGVTLFIAALFSMFTGKASPANLVVGLMGIVLMTPAGGYFLLGILNRRDGAA